jgi:ParB family chromosome partitioning protein
MAVKKKYASLGRGLDALISTETVSTSGSSTINEIDVNLIEANPNQPRREFDEQALQELAASIKELGIIQPITLRQIGDNRFQIIAGERRWRASQLAGLKAIPAYIRTISDETVMELALVENIQREDLNAIEIALTMSKLIDQYHLTQERLSERIGKNRATIANFLRLLKLPAEIQRGLRDKKLDMGHARALLPITDPALQLKLYNETLKKGLSVRQVEQLAKQYQESAKTGKDEGKKSSKRHGNEDFSILTNHLSKAFGVPVKFACDASGKGKITFAFNNDDDLDRIISIFDRLK